MENADVVIMITMQKRKKDEKLFLAFLLCKQRYHECKITFFNQPFDEDTFNLEDDVLLKKAKGVISLATDFEDIDLELYEKRGRTKHMLDENEKKPRKVEMDLFSLNPLS